jgi:hypothetical protein
LTGRRQATRGKRAGRRKKAARSLPRGKHPPEGGVLQVQVQSDPVPVELAASCEFHCGYMSLQCAYPVARAKAGWQGGRVAMRGTEG